MNAIKKLTPSARKRKVEASLHHLYAARAMLVDVALAIRERSKTTSISELEEAQLKVAREQIAALSIVVDILKKGF